MGKSFKLTLKERYYINMYVRQLPCTLALRRVIDQFIEQIDITPEEVAQYSVKFDVTDGFTSTGNDVEFDYESFPMPVIDAVASYIKMYGHEKNAENKMLQTMISYFSKLV